MTLRKALFIVGFAALALLAIMVAVTVVRQRAAQEYATTSSKMRDATIAARTADQTARNAELAAAMAPLQARIAQLDTALKAATVMQEHAKLTAYGERPAPVVIERAKAEKVMPPADIPTPQDAEDNKVVLMTGDFAQDIAKQQLTCDLTTKRLDACVKDLADEAAKGEQQRLKAEEYAKALKGGTTFQRIAHEGKLIGCTGAGAAVGGYTKGWQGAAIGAVAAGLVCAIAR